MTAFDQPSTSTDSQLFLQLEPAGGCLCARLQPSPSKATVVEFFWSVEDCVRPDNKLSTPILVPEPGVNGGELGRLPEALLAHQGLKIHTPMPFDHKIDLIHAFHTAEVIDLYCEASYEDDFGRRVVEAFERTLPTLRRLRLLHNPPVEEVPLSQAAPAGALLDPILGRFKRLTHLKLMSRALSCDALRSLPPTLESLQVQAFRPGTPFCDPDAILAVFEDPAVEFGALRELVVFDEDDEVWEDWEEDIRVAAEPRGVRFERVGEVPFEPTESDVRGLGEF